MKKRMLLTAMIFGLAVVAAGCGKSENAKGTTKVEETTEQKSETTEENAEIANPWVESDKEGVTAATNIELNAPEDAEDIVYAYLTGENLAQVTFSRGNQNWIYRAVMSDSFDDISGMYYDWANEENVTVSGREAVLLDYSSDQETVWMINWYDAVPGVMYSLSVTVTNAEDLDGLDMQGMAESLYVPMQDET